MGSLRAAVEDAGSLPRYDQSIEKPLKVLSVFLGPSSKPGHSELLWNTPMEGKKL